MRIRLVLSLLSSLIIAFNVNATHISFVTEHLPPYQMKKNHMVTGYITEIVKQMMTYTPYSYSMNIYPWSRAYHLALYRNNTCVFSTVKTSRRKNKFKWIGPLLNVEFSFIGLKDRKISIHSLDDAKKYKIGVIRDDVAHQYLQEHGFKADKNLYILNNTHSMLNLLSKRKFVDLIVTSASSIPYRAQYNHLDDKSFKIYFTLNNAKLKYYIACNDAMNSKIIKQLRSALEQLKKDGKYQKIQSYWLSQMKSIVTKK